MRLHRSLILFSFAAMFAVLFISCAQDNKVADAAIEPPVDRALNQFFNRYYKGYSKLFPLESTINGNNDFNDQLEISFTQSHRNGQRDFYQRYKDSLKTFDRDKLNINDRISYDIFSTENALALEHLKYKDNHLVINQFYSMPQYFGQAGSGSGFQPFNTVKDYENWLSRAGRFSDWVDSAIVYMRAGITEKVVLPRSLVVKIIPQMDAMVEKDPSKSLFYGPVNNIPATFSAEDAAKFKSAYETLIREKIVPAYQRLGDFLKNEYLPAARSGSGVNELPDGAAYYNFMVRYQTTTNKSPQEIYDTGLAEVKRILGHMDSIKNVVGFEGDRQAFFTYLRSDKKFMPYKKPEEVLDAFRKIHETMKPRLNEMFSRVPKSRFEIRQTEAFRAESASAEYNAGSPDGSRPGIFYIPIVDATKFNTTSGMESLFLHEAIPGHHYQLSLQMEDTTLPDFRRFGGNNAYVEGWALYCESLGKELGLYTDPYQYMGALGDEIHRAIRLVVDVGLHTGKMTREEAIKYMMDNEAISEQGAVAEIERYMAMPGQALGYKIGALKIRELRDKYEQQYGKKFSVAAFHEQLLKYGAMPLDVLENFMDNWALTLNVNR